MIHLQPPHEIPRQTPPSVFLAGTIDMGASENWQLQVVQELQDLDVTILNPRRSDWDSSWTQDPDQEPFRGQVEWELRAQDRADIILFHFSPNSKSPITLLELGLALGRGVKPLVYCPKEFYRYGNIEITCRKYGVVVFHDFNTLIFILRQQLWSKIRNPQ